MPTVSMLCLDVTNTTVYNRRRAHLGEGYLQDMLLSSRTATIEVSDGKALAAPIGDTVTPCDTPAELQGEAQAAIGTDDFAACRPARSTDVYLWAT